jgi:formate hydrogenlyase subunit 4
MLARACSLLLPLLLAPALLAVINRTKALIAGRRGPPLLQPYFDLAKLLRKGAVYSRTTTWVFRVGPPIGLAAAVLAVALTPLGGVPAAAAFSADALLFAYLLGAMRFAAVAAALDTGSSFEGMGASREVTFSALAEPALLLAVAGLVRHSGSASLSAMYGAIDAAVWGANAPALAFLAAALLIVFLVENARVPVDDPTTHLELTMIHEVMHLDHGGPDLACIQYASALKLWVLGMLIVGLVVPVRSGVAAIDAAAALGGLAALAVVVGLIESSMARWRLLRVPQMLVGAGAFALLGLALMVR